VSTAWRCFTLATRELWTAIHLEYHCKILDNLCINQLPLIRCQLQLQRSGSLPLIVDATLLEAECHLSLFRLAATYCSRWKRLEFQVLSGVTNIPRQMSHKFHLLQLEAIEVNCGHQVRNAILLPFLSDVLPRLTSLTVILSHSLDPLHPLPWNQLTFLNFDYYLGDVTGLLQLLRNVTRDYDHQYTTGSQSFPAKQHHPGPPFRDGPQGRQLDRRRTLSNPPIPSNAKTSFDSNAVSRRGLSA
jgi:hypothetical protein